MSRKATPVSRLERPLTGVDLVMFTVRDERLHVLLTQRPDRPGEPFPHRWALPGGLIDVERDDSLEACARRKLAEKTGVTTPTSSSSEAGAAAPATRAAGPPRTSTSR